MLGRDELAKWCTSRGLHIDTSGTIEFTPRGPAWPVVFEGASIVQLGVLVENIAPNWIDRPFAGGVVAWDTTPHWGENIHAVGALLATLLLSCPPDPPFETGRAVLFDRHEHAHMQLAILCGVIAAWDTMVVCGDAAVHLSHDGVATVRTQSRQALDDLKRRFVAVLDQSNGVKQE